MKVISGTRLAKNTVVLKQPEGGMRQFRCPKCQMLATPVYPGTNDTSYQCGGCGAQYRTRALT